MLMWWGGCPCSNVPDVEAVTVATFDAFPASRYRIDQLAEAHAAYCAHLKVRVRLRLRLRLRPRLRVS